MIQLLVCLRIRGDPLLYPGQDFLIGVVTDHWCPFYGLMKGVVFVVKLDTWSLVHSLLMLELELGSYPFTNFRYSVMFGDVYSAQDRNRNSVGGPKSLIMQFSSPLRLFQYCLVPCTLPRMLDKFPSSSSSLLSSLARSSRTEDLSISYIPDTVVYF